LLDIGVVQTSSTVVGQSSSFDPFLGSGTTAVAAIMEGRQFLGCDIDPGCVETTRRRLVELAACASEEAGNAPT
jgi:tRNA G10  N-methylase Trm11